MEKQIGWFVVFTVITAFKIQVLSTSEIKCWGTFKFFLAYLGYALAKKLPKA